MTKWGNANKKLSIRYLKDAYITYHNIYCENRYINAIELLSRSLLFLVYSLLKEKDCIVTENDFYKPISELIKNTDLKNIEILTKLSLFRNKIVHS
jgi:hypothetical protein